MRIDLQLSAAVTPWPDLRDGARAAEEAGFDTLWTFDHLSGAVLRGHTMLECWTLLGALAVSTERIGLGTLVVNVANRPAGVLAVAAATAQTISGGRLRLGLGAGAAPTAPWAREQRAVGMALRPTVAGRHAALVEALDLLDAMWSAGPSDDGEDRFAGFPVPAVRPPVILGVSSAALARIAAERCDGVNLRGHAPEMEDLLAAARRARGDRPGPWEVSVWTFWDEALLRPDHPERRRYARLGVDRLVLTSLVPLPTAAIAAAAPLLAEGR